MVKFSIFLSSLLIIILVELSSRFTSKQLCMLITKDLDTLCESCQFAGIEC